MIGWVASILLINLQPTTDRQTILQSTHTHTYTPVWTVVWGQLLVASLPVSGIQPELQVSLFLVPSASIVVVSTCTWSASPVGEANTTQTASLSLRWNEKQKHDYNRSKRSIVIKCSVPCASKFFNCLQVDFNTCMRQ